MPGEDLFIVTLKFVIFHRPSRVVELCVNWWGKVEKKSDEDSGYLISAGEGWFDSTLFCNKKMK